MSLSRFIQMGAAGVSAGDDPYANWTHPDIANRQALRDITSQAGFPFSVTWPVKV